MCRHDRSYTIKRRGAKPLTLWCVTMIDPATGWFEMKQVKNKEAHTVATVVDMICTVHLSVYEV